MKIIFLLVSLFYLILSSKSCFEVLISDKSECSGRYIKNNENNNMVCCFIKATAKGGNGGMSACIELEKEEADINKLKEQLNSLPFHNIILEELVCDE